MRALACCLSVQETTPASRWLWNADGHRVYSGAHRGQREVKCGSEPSLHCACAGEGAHRAVAQRHVRSEAGVGSSSLGEDVLPYGAGLVPSVSRSSATSPRALGWFKMRLPPPSQQIRAGLTRSSDNSTWSVRPLGGASVHFKGTVWRPMALRAVTTADQMEAPCPACCPLPGCGSFPRPPLGGAAERGAPPLLPVVFGRPGGLSGFTHASIRPSMHGFLRARLTFGQHVSVPVTAVRWVCPVCCRLCYPR